MKLLCFFSICVILFFSCEFERSTQLKGVIQSDSSFLSVYGGKKSVLSILSIDLKSFSSNGIRECRLSPTLYLELGNKRYVLMLDSSKVPVSDWTFECFQKEDKEWKNWLYLPSNDLNNKNWGLVLSEDGLKKYDTRSDSISPLLFGYSSYLDNYVAIAILKDTLKLVNKKYCHIISEMEKRYIHGYEPSSGIVECAKRKGYDIVNGRMIEGWSKLDSLQLGTNMAQNCYTRSLIRELEEEVGRKLKYISEYTLSPGDSISFEGRISNDTIYAFQ